VRDLGAAFLVRVPAILIVLRTQAPTNTAPTPTSSSAPLNLPVASPVVLLQTGLLLGMQTLRWSGPALHGSTRG
jgi:hypothetical protein